MNRIIETSSSLQKTSVPTAERRLRQKKVFLTQGEVVVSRFIFALKPKLALVSCRVIEEYLEEIVAMCQISRDYNRCLVFLQASAPYSSMGIIMCHLTFNYLQVFNGENGKWPTR